MHVAPPATPPLPTFLLAHPGLCPNSCSGNGVCKLLGDLTDVLTIPYDASNWDVDRIQACVCDNGYFGADCSQREWAMVCGRIG